MADPPPKKERAADQAKPASPAIKSGRATPEPARCACGHQCAPQGMHWHKKKCTFVGPVEAPVTGLLDDARDLIEGTRP